MSVPFFHHQRYPHGQMSASFVDNGYRGHYEFSPANEYRITFDGGQYTEYIFAGPHMPAILRSYTDLTGRMQLPPIWALVTTSAGGTSTTKPPWRLSPSAIATMTFPDALWLDIDYMDGYRVFTWDTESFPDGRGMVKRLGEQGFRVITIIDPGVKYEPGYWVFDQGFERTSAALRAATSTSASVAGQHGLPRLRHRRGACLVGQTQRGLRAVRPRRDLERHE